mgnify:CR=1 FL=1
MNKDCGYQNQSKNEIILVDMHRIKSRQKVFKIVKDKGVRWIYHNSENSKNVDKEGLI